MNENSWQRCQFCGETYHVLNGHYVPSRNISACEYCVKAGWLDDREEGR